MNIRAKLPGLLSVCLFVAFAHPAHAQWVVESYTADSPTTSVVLVPPIGAGEFRISGSFYFSNQRPQGSPHYPCLRFNDSFSGYENLKLEIIGQSTSSHVPPFTDCGVISSDTHTPASMHFKAWGNLVPLAPRTIGSASSSFETATAVPTADQNSFKWDNAVDPITKIEITTEFNSQFRGEFIVEYYLSGLSITPPPPPPPPPPPTQTSQVSASADDGIECGAGPAKVTTDWLAADFSCWAATRFNVSLSAPVTGAHVEYQQGGTNSNSPNLRIYAETNCSTAQIQAISGDIKNRPLSAASVPWQASNLSGLVQSPDIGPVINDLLAGCGGVSDVTLIFVPSGGNFNMPAWDMNPSNALKLIIQ